MGYGQRILLDYPIDSGLAMPNGVLFWQNGRCIKAYRHKVTRQVIVEIKPEKAGRESGLEMAFLKMSFLPCSILSVYALEIQMRFFRAYFPDLWSRILISPCFTLEFYFLLLGGFVFGAKVFCPELTAYHAVEHKTINAYIKKKQKITLADLKKANRYSKNCGGRFLAALALTDAFVYAPGCIFWREFYGNSFFDFAGLLLFIPLIKFCLAEKGIKEKIVDRFSWVMQICMTTKEPKEEQLEVGLAALKWLYS